MSVSITIFDPTTQNSKAILVSLEASLIQSDEDAEIDYYIRMTTDAKRGAACDEQIPSEVFRSLTELSLGTAKFKDSGMDETSTDAYENLTQAVEDYVLKMIEGVNPGEHMCFTA
jgi:hypothetical protein